MRQARIKVAAADGEAVYHVMSRTVNGEQLIDDVGREVLRKQLWQVAEFCGVEVLTYAILSNHFHILVRVPQTVPVSDSELLRRYRVLYPRPTRYQQDRLEVIEQQLAAGGPEGERWRRRQRALMNDVSQYMKLVKQRFTIWHNKSHRRYGTLWAERFKSVLVEPHGRVVEMMAAYIDLNAVRAGLVTDPKDYRFCGYAEAVAGGAVAQSGIRSVIGGGAWLESQAVYRQVLFGVGAGPRADGGRLTMEQLQAVVRDGGKLPLSAVLRCRVRYFSDGAVLGSKAFVEVHLERYRERTGRRLRTTVRSLPTVTDWGEIASLRALRGGGLG